MRPSDQLPITSYPLPFSRFLSIQSTYGPSFSPDGQRLALLSNITGVPQAWVMPAGGGWPSPLTFEKDPGGQRLLGPAADALIFARDLSGNENAHLYWVRGDGSGERRLTAGDDAMHINIGFAGTHGLIDGRHP
jgi:Tol biopolymer transport system component